MTDGEKLRDLAKYFEGIPSEPCNILGGHIQDELCCIADKLDGYETQADGATLVFTHGTMTPERIERNASLKWWHLW